MGTKTLEHALYNFDINKAYICLYASSRVLTISRLWLDTFLWSISVSEAEERTRKRAHGEVEGRTRKRQKNINTEQPATPTQRFPPFSVLNSHIQQTDGHPRLTQPAQSSPSLAGFLCQPQQSGGDSEPDTRITARTSQNVIMAEYSVSSNWLLQSPNIHWYICFVLCRTTT